MTRLKSLLLALTLLPGAALACETPAGAAQMKAEAAAAVNAQRKAAGLRDLGADSKLDQAAQKPRLLDGAHRHL